MTLDAAIRSTCHAQSGAISRAQLLRLTNRNAVARRVANGMLTRVGARGYVLTGTPDTLARRAMVAVIESGRDALLSHTSAAAMWGISGFEVEPIHTAIERHRRLLTVDGVTIHHATVIPHDERRRLDGLPIASPALTLFTLASILAPNRLEQAVDSAWSQRLVDGPTLRMLLERLARRGRNGVVAMRDILDGRGHDWTPPQSNLESRFLRLMIDAGIDEFAPQVWIDDGPWTGRVDFMHERLGIVVEVQSERYHTALTDRRNDDSRRRHLEGRGLTLVEVWDADIFHRPHEVVSRVLLAIRTAELRSRYPSASESDALG